MNASDAASLGDNGGGKLSVPEHVNVIPNNGNRGRLLDDTPVDCATADSCQSCVDLGKTMPDDGDSTCVWKDDACEKVDKDEPILIVL